MSIQSANRKQGATGEAIVAMELRSRGVYLVERVHTPWGIQRANGGRITGAHPLEKVAGDFVGILAGGRFVRGSKDNGRPFAILAIGATPALGTATAPRIRWIGVSGLGA